MPNFNFTPAQAIDNLIFYANNYLYLPGIDNIYIRNKLLRKLHLYEPARDYTPPADILRLQRVSDILAPLVNYALENNITTPQNRYIFEAELLDIVCPPPSFIVDYFDELASEKGIAHACDFLYELNIKSNHIRSEEVLSNIKWTARGQKGDFEIIINAALPVYNHNCKYYNVPNCPKCLSGEENREVMDDNDYLATLSLRPIPLILQDTQWNFLYTPYKYLDYHFIVCSGIHDPSIKREAINYMLDFLDLFPFYYVGFDAAFHDQTVNPCIRDHFQGGADAAPLHKAAAKHRFVSPEFPNARVFVPDWHCNVIRIESRNRETIEQLYNKIFETFSGYNNQKINIKASADGKILNTVSPIIGINQDKEYSLDIVLRNTADSNVIPPELQNIKSGQIGLLDYLGVFVLPGNLASDADEIKNFLTGKNKLTDLKDPAHPLGAHVAMIAQLINDHGTDLSDEDAGAAVEAYITRACERILKSAAVFKDTEEGQNALFEFMASAGFEEITSV